MSRLAGKSVVLGVSGSIAAYKAAELASRLTQAGALVDAVLTPAACRFVTPLTFRSITRRPVLTDPFDPDSEMALEHVGLARRAGVLAVVPATADVIARLALGRADDALTLTALATPAPLLVAPAMDGHMWQNQATRANVRVLLERGAVVVGPVEGHLASGMIGPGRMAEPGELMGHIAALLGRTGDLAGRKVVVSAGGTEEPIDPVRVVTNRSSGKMGYALAEAARDRGAGTVLVTARTGLPQPAAMRAVRVGTAVEMADALLRETADADALIMAAAVADYRPASTAPQKVKRGSNRWVLELERNPDILGRVCRPGLVSVGFAAESEEVLEHARTKMEAKQRPTPDAGGLDLMVANDVTAPESRFGSDTNRVWLLDRDGGEEALPVLPKHEVAHRVLDRVSPRLG